jgi:hypothetical protein
VYRGLQHGGLKGLYRLVELHFHWGRAIDEDNDHLMHGSEHVLAHLSYPLEVNTWCNCAWEEVIVILQFADAHCARQAQRVGKFHRQTGRRGRHVL